MTQSDYRSARSIISDILFGNIGFEDKIKFTKKLQLLNLTEMECMHLFEYIDEMNTEFNMLCWECRNTCREYMSRDNYGSSKKSS
jgi:hypothetical protein